MDKTADAPLEMFRSRGRIKNHGLLAVPRGEESDLRERHLWDRV
jgi:hypothetical protein